LFTARSKVDLNDSSVCRLFRSNQVGKWKHEVPFDRALEMPGSIGGIGPFAKQKSSGAPGVLQHEGLRSKGKNTFLYGAQLDVENPIHFLRREILEHDYLLQPVHKLWGEILFCGVQRGTVQPLTDGTSLLCPQAGDFQRFFGAVRIRIRALLHCASWDPDNY